jgi:hypothetical protein
MKTEKTQTPVFLVLVPHRDTRLVLRNYSATLFRAGYTGAYHFPWAAPLAALARPFTKEELKDCARTLRESTGKDGFSAAEPGVLEFPFGSSALFGPRLDLTIENTGSPEKTKVIRFFSPTVIGSCLLPAAESRPPHLCPPPLSFRAAAVANMYFRPMALGLTGCKWKIGNLVWLPKK